MLNASSALILITNVGGLRFVRKIEGIFADIENGWPPLVSPRPGNTLSFSSRTLSLPVFEELNHWFPPQLAVSLAGIADAAHECREPHYEKVALVSLSASIVAKWPNTLSYAMDIDHTRPHRQVQRFRLKSVLRTYLARLDRTIGCLGNIHMIYRRSGVAEKLPSLARIFCPHDAREPVPSVEEDSQAVVVTSPPYFNAVDYPRAHRMAVCWMNGWAPTNLTSRHNYIGLHGAPGLDADEWLSPRPEIRRLIPRDILTGESVRRRLSGFFADLETVLREIRRVLRPQGHAVIVIGDNIIKGQRVASHKAVIQLAESLGFEKLDASRRRIATLRRRYPVGPFGFDGPMTHEFVLVLRKSPRSIRSRA